MNSLVIFIINLYKKIQNEYFHKILKKCLHALHNYLKITLVDISNLWVLMKQIYRWDDIQNKCYFKFYIINNQKTINSS